MMEPDPATGLGIARQREESARMLRKKHSERVMLLQRLNQLTFHTSSTFMDYLHGDVDRREAEIAGCYEYARESEALWNAAVERDRLLARPKNCHLACKAVARMVVRQHRGEWFSTDLVSIAFLMCESFPKRDWNELTSAERADITRLCSISRNRPPLMDDLRSLEAFGVLDQLRAKARSAEPMIKDVPPNEKEEPMNMVWPVVQEQSGAVHRALFTLDFSKTETRLLTEFRQWLRIPENQERFDKHVQLKTGVTGKTLDRLKDLAAWRLYRELGNDWEAANEFAKRHRKKFTAQQIRDGFKTKEQRKRYRQGDPRPFRDAKGIEEKQANGKLVVISPNQAELFGEAADAREAKARAWMHLATVIPQELYVPGPDMLAAFDELEKLAGES